ncbi:uncharacterized protein METZ01_LOCUS157768 [marine metagenome]|uniref:Uncharacterized protein n=1 Tax=marine metagenome TaxID=408172 RepID=A0A382AU70_9ZZZZ
MSMQDFLMIVDFFAHNFISLQINI